MTYSIPGYDAWKLASPPEYNSEARCVCGCLMIDHIEPDLYDMGNQDLDADGHLNHCGDCGTCYSPEEEWCCDAGPVGHGGRHWKED